MSKPLIVALREARASLSTADTVEPGEAAVARKLGRELDDAIAHLEGAKRERDLVSIICHDLKDPLASILMGAGYLRKTIPSDESAGRRVVDAIARSAERMGQVVTDFHDLARLEAGLLTVDPRPCDLAAALAAALPPWEAEAQERKLVLTLEVAEKCPAALCDRGRVLQVATKLIGNAFKFTPPEGRVAVRVAGKDGRVSVSVTDTGKGIAAERLPMLFDHDTNARRSARDGPGFGLAIVRGLLELQRGEVTVDSRLGGGSTFTFTLPSV